MKQILLTSVLVVLLAPLATSAAISPAKIFSDHMVLQRHQPVPLWGKANVGAPVVVEFDGQSAKTRADSNGRWKLTLEPMKANSSSRDIQHLKKS